jgi:hypothetical protein
MSATTQEKEVIMSNDLLEAYLLPYEEKFRIACNAGYGCGYVKIDKSHPCYKDIQLQLFTDNYGYNMYQIDFSNQITYTDIKQDYAIIGFDTAHSCNKITDTKQMCVDDLISLFQGVNSITLEDVQNYKNRLIKKFIENLNKIII